jgi:hypothetical protein
MSGTFRLADLAAARNRQMAPQGPPQATTLVRGQPHMMAYITPDEAYILRNRGGGLAGGSRDLQLEQSGIPAFADNEGGGGNNDGGGGGNNDGGGGGYGGGDGGNDRGGGGFNDGGGSADTSGKDAGDKYGGGGDPNDSAQQGSFGAGGDPGSAYGGLGGGVPAGMGYGGLYDTRASDVGSRAGSPNSGGGEAGFFGGEANYGGGEGVHGGSGGTEGNQPYYAPSPTPLLQMPAGPTPEELAEKERLRLLALDDEAERRVRAKYDKSVGATWREALGNKFNSDATGLLTDAYGTTRAGLLSALQDSGYIATPLATARIAGLDKQKEGETSKIPGIQNTRLGDYDARRNTSLVDAIKRARAGHDPDAADLLADASIEQLNSSISTNPGAAYTPAFSVDSGIITPTESAVQTSAADNFRNALLQVRSPAAAARVA